MSTTLELHDPLVISRLSAKIDLIAIGCSAGGVDALGKILPALPASFRQTVVVVIHLSPEVRSLLVEIFQPKCRMLVKEAEDKEVMQAGTVYFAPANHHLLVEPDASFSLSVEEQVQYSRPSIDLLFESVAFSYRQRAVGLILTGANSDGAAGLRLMGDAGAIRLVEDPSSALHPTMPNAAIEAGAPDAVMDLQGLTDWLGALTRAGRGA